VAISLRNLSLVYKAKGEYAKAVEFAGRANDVSELALSSILATGSEDQKQAYFNTLWGSTYGTVSLHVQSAPALSEAARLSLTTILRRKGRVLEAMRDLFRVLRQHADPNDTKRIDEIARARAELAARSLRGPARGEDPQIHERDLAERHKAVSQIEESLASRYAALGLKQIPVTLEAVQGTLPLDAALVEYFVYRPLDSLAKPGDRWGKERYVAYVLRRRGDPGWADLGEAERIDRLARETRSKYASGDRAAAKSARELARLVVEPVRRLLGDATHVLLSPDGELNLVPFGALPDEHGKYLVKRYQFTYLSSGRDLLRMNQIGDAHEEATIMAAPDYGERERRPEPSSKDRDGERGFRSVDMGAVAFLPLPGTLAEANQLAATLGKARVLTGAQATERALKTMHGPRLLHLATHGFFLDDLPAPIPQMSERGISHIGTVGRPVAGAEAMQGITPMAQVLPPPTRPTVRLENPLLRSGLALAGANRRMSGNDDGILTAMETMSLDLVGTQLVVLSACETGIGEVRNGEGVFGLRRAFVLAGAETQIMTLWKIDDEITARLMSEYYERIGKGEGRSGAMRAVVLRMLANPKTANPQYWASFIVSGDSRPLHEASR
jgi:CHAT domain-containing protein